MKWHFCYGGACGGVKVQPRRVLVISCIKDLQASPTVAFWPGMAYIMSSKTAHWRSLANYAMTTSPRQGVMWSTSRLRSSASSKARASASPPPEVMESQLQKLRELRHPHR